MPPPPPCSTTTTAGVPLNEPFSVEGGITRVVPPGVEFPRGGRVMLKAISEAGYLFSHWEGDVLESAKSSNPLVLTMDSDRSVTPVFVEETVHPPGGHAPNTIEEGAFTFVRPGGSCLRGCVLF